MIKAGFMDKNSGSDKQKEKSMLIVMLRHYGVLRVTLTFTFLSVLASVAVTTALLHCITDDIPLAGIAIAAVVPSIIAPFFTYNSNKLVHRLDIAEERLRLLSNTDELSQTYNRRYFFEHAHQEFERAKRYGHPFAIAILDFDNFKHINDGYGHLAGDAALKYVAQVFLSGLRHVDIFARYGGDEFVLLFPDTYVQAAKEGLERILAGLGEADFQYSGFSIPIRISIGVSAYHETMEALDDILREADFALYAAKRQGGMRVIAHPT